MTIEEEEQDLKNKQLQRKVLFDLQEEQRRQKEDALQAKASRAVDQLRSDQNLQGVADAVEKAQEAKKQFDNYKKKYREFKKKKEKLQEDYRLFKKKRDEAKKEPKVKGKKGGKKGRLARLVANNIGLIRGILIAQIEERIVDFLSKFVNGCPNQKVIAKIIKAKNNISNAISKFQSTATKYRGIAGTVVGIARTLQLLIDIILEIAIPTAVIPPGGGVGIPQNIILKNSHRLIKFQTLVDAYADEAEAILSIVDQVLPVIAGVKDRLDSIDLSVKTCVEDPKTPQEYEDIILQVQPPENTGSEGPPEVLPGVEDPAFKYDKYTLEIILDPNSPAIAPRRYAVARDNRGIIVMKGQPSFSASTDVLLDEVKFRLDQLKQVNIRIGVSNESNTSTLAVQSESAKLSKQQQALLEDQKAQIDAQAAAQNIGANAIAQQTANQQTANQQPNTPPTIATPTTKTNFYFTDGKLSVASIAKVNQLTVFDLRNLNQFLQQTYQAASPHSPSIIPIPGTSSANYVYTDTTKIKAGVKIRIGY